MFVFVHSSKFKKKFRVPGEDPVFRYPLNHPDDLFQSFYVLEKRMDAQTLSPSV